MKRFTTKIKKKGIEYNEALSIYTILKENIKWEDGVRSRKGFTRKAFSMDVGDFGYELVMDTIKQAINSLELEKLDNYDIGGIYLNYYANGEMYTPNHRHSKSIQLVISLGVSRTFQLGKKKYTVDNGDVIAFGSSTHGVPKDSSVKDGRISIACF